MNEFGVDSKATGARRDARVRARGRVAGASLIVVVALVVAGWVWWPSQAHRAAPAAPRSVAVAFRTRLPLLRAMLESPPTVSVTNAIRSLRARNPQALHRHVASRRPLRVMVVGDSVGASFARGLELWAAANGKTQVLDEARWWCALGRRLPIQQGISNGPPNSACADWGSRWAYAIRSFNPDVVFVLFTIWEVVPRQLPDRNDWEQPGAGPIDAWQLSEYQSAADVLSARGAAVVWFTIPCEDELIRTGTPLWQIDRRTIPALAASRPAVHVVDLDHELCQHGPGHDYAGVHEARPDGAHFSEAGAFAVADWVMPIVFGDTPNPVTVGESATVRPSVLIRRAG